MKGGLSASLCAAAFVDRADIAGTILVTATVAEELLIGRGLGKILEGRKVDAVITCEPTGVNQLAVAGVGRTTVEMTARGLVDTAPSPTWGDNADLSGHGCRRSHTCDAPSDASAVRHGRDPARRDK